MTSVMFVHWQTVNQWLAFGREFNVGWQGLFFILSFSMTFSKMFRKIVQSFLFLFFCTLHVLKHIICQTVSDTNSLTSSDYKNSLKLLIEFEVMMYLFSTHNWIEYFISNRMNRSGEKKWLTRLMEVVLHWWHYF